MNWVDTYTGPVRSHAHLQRLVFELNVNTERVNMADPDYQLMERLLSEVPIDSMGARRLHAEAYVVLEQWDKALPLLDQVGAAEPLDWDAQVMFLGALLIRLQQGQTRAFLDAVDMWRERQERWSGLHYGMMGGADEALELIRFARFDLPIRPYQRGLSLLPAAHANNISLKLESDLIREILPRFEQVWPADPAATIDLIEQFIPRLRYDKGCVIKRRLLQPEVVATLFELRARALEKLGRKDDAARSHARGEEFRLIHPK